MKPRILAALALTLIFLVACTKPPGSTFVVLFQEAPHLTDASIYDPNGAVLAQITKTTINRDNSARIDIAADPKQAVIFSRNLVFVAVDGRLHAAHLSGSSDPIPAGSRIAGFSSTKSLFWFKMRHMLGNNAAKAAAMADEIDAAR